MNEASYAPVFKAFFIRTGRKPQTVLDFYDMYEKNVAKNINSFKKANLQTISGVIQLTDVVKNANLMEWSTDTIKQGMTEVNKAILMITYLDMDMAEKHQILDSFNSVLHTLATTGLDLFKRSRNYQIGKGTFKIEGKGWRYYDENGKMEHMIYPNWGDENDLSLNDDEKQRNKEITKTIREEIVDKYAGADFEALWEKVGKLSKEQLEKPKKELEEYITLEE